jgi:predicted NBD/HSP70 family sugar kinase
MSAKLLHGATTVRRINLKRANVARPNTIRDINRQIILNLVREREPLARAEIAQETALHRSTISIILEELMGDGLIEEIGAGESTGGRPPTLLRIRAAGAVAIGVDLGTARTLMATSDLAGRVLEQEEFATDPDAEKTLGHIIECARKLFKRSGGTIEGIGISVPGIVNPDNMSAHFVPFFGWRDLAMAHKISAATKLPTTIDNDANAAALAELWFGRPEVREARDFILVLVAEGLGTGVVFDGQVYKGERGAAGEFGHMTIGEGAPVACASGSYNCWESFASEHAALARYARLSRRADARGALRFDDLIDRALDEDGPARAALAETAHYLGVGISNLIKGLSPEAVIVGGPIVRAWPVIFQEISAAIEENPCHMQPTARIMASTLGTQPTLMGALSLVLASKFASVPTT